MFKRRSDATYVKGLDTITKAGPFFLVDRIESQNLYMNAFRCEKLDEFIQKERRNGNTFSYTHFMIASIVRLYYLRPKLNYFISNKNFYEHKDISVSMVIKKALTDNGEEVTLKIPFTGRESIFEVKEKIDKAIAENISYDETYETTKKAGALNHLPNWLFKFFMWFVKKLDKHNMMPKSLIKASPFHTSVFVTNLKSLKLDALHHHLYHFGTCSLFIAMGKEKIVPVVEGNKEIKMGKVMNVGITMDERVADGFYFGKTLKIWTEMFENPDCLKESMPDNGSKVMKIKKRRVKKTKEKKIKKITSKTKSRSKLTTKEKLERQKALRREVKEQKEKIKAQIKADKEALKHIKEETIKMEEIENEEN